jgi:hypothetical protein
MNQEVEFENDTARTEVRNANQDVYNQDVDLDEDSEWYMDGQYNEEEESHWAEPRKPKGNILHFIPSEQIKLLKGKFMINSNDANQNADNLFCFLIRFSSTEGH